MADARNDNSSPAAPVIDKPSPPGVTDGAGGAGGGPLLKPTGTTWLAALSMDDFQSANEDEDEIIVVGDIRRPSSGPRVILEVSTVKLEPHLSYFRLSFEIHHQESPSSPMCATVAYYNISHAQIRTSAKGGSFAWFNAVHFTPISSLSEEELEGVKRSFPNMIPDDKAAKDELGLLDLDITSSGGVWSENLFTEVQYSPSKIGAAINKVRSLQAVNQITLLIDGGQEALYEVEEVSHHLEMQARSHWVGLQFKCHNSSSALFERPNFLSRSRPNIDPGLQRSFANKLDMAFTVGLPLHLESIILKYQTDWIDARARFFTIPNAGHRRYMVHFRFPDRKTSFHIREHDKITVNLIPSSERTENHYVVTVTKTSALGAISDVTGYMSAKYTEYDSRLPGPRKMIDFPSHVTAALTSSTSSPTSGDASSIDVQVQSVAQKGVLPKLTHGLKIAWKELDDTWWAVQLGNTVSGLPKINAFKNLIDYGTPECDEYLRQCSKRASPTQASIFTAVQNAPGGITIVEGAAGSGKTRSIIDITTALTCRQTCGGFDQVMVSVSLNTAANTLARKMRDHLEAERTTLGLESHGPLVIRVFNYSTTTQVALAEEMTARPHTNADKPPVIQSDGEGALSKADMAAVPDLMKMFEEHGAATFQKVPNVDDRRIDDATLDAGYHMKRRLGMGPQGTRDPFAQPHLYGNLIHEMKKYRNGLILNEEERSQMTTHLGQLFDDVIQSALVIIGTEVSLMDPAIRRIARPVVRIADESSRLSEAADLALGAYYAKTIHSTIYFGDRFQPIPFVSPVAESRSLPFLAQQKLSKFMRLIDIGHQPVTLRQNHRFEPSIAAMIKTIWYGDLLEPSPELSSTFEANKFRDWTDQALDCGKTNIVIVNVPSRPVKGLSSSRVSEEEALAVNWTVEKLQGHYPAKDIAIFTPYSAHKALLARITDRFARNDPDWRENSPRTADGCGGLEAKVAIISLAADDFTRFLNDPKRMLTISTRGRYGLIIIGNVDEAKTKNNWQYTQFGKMILFTTKQGKIITPAIPQPSAEVLALLPTVNARFKHREFLASRLAKPKGICGKCGQEGHRVVGCTNERVLLCSTCGKVGHYRASCPDKH